MNELKLLFAKGTWRYMHMWILCRYIGKHQTYTSWTSRATLRRNSLKEGARRKTIDARDPRGATWGQLWRRRTGAQKMVSITKDSRRDGVTQTHVLHVNVIYILYVIFRREYLYTFRFPHRVISVLPVRMCSQSIEKYFLRLLKS